jgi:phytoene desaturase
VRLADGRVFAAEALVSNADAAFTYRKLVDPRYRRKYTDRRLRPPARSGRGAVWPRPAPA